MAAEEIAPWPMELGNSSPARNRGTDKIGPRAAEAAGHADDANGLFHIFLSFVPGTASIHEVQSVSVSHQGDRGDPFTVAGPMPTTTPAGPQATIPALDRTQPGLPMKRGKAGTMTFDYKRNGTTTLFAAVDVLEGTVIGHCMQRYRHQEFIRFLNAIERAVPAGKLVHVILDNYATHKHPKVLRWLGRHPRFVFHFTPTSCSWPNAVETFFSRLTRRRLKRGVFRSVVDLQAAINRFIEDHNAEPIPFVWTADPDTILGKVTRGIQALASVH
jgi:transposase